MSCKYKIKIDEEDYCSIPTARIINGKRIEIKHEHCPYQNGFERILNDKGVPTVYSMCHEEAGEYLKEVIKWKNESEKKQLENWLRKQK